MVPRIPGTGKTALSSIVVRHSQSILPTPSTIIAYVYFECKDNEGQTVPQMLSNLLRQCLDQIETVPQKTLLLYNRRPTGQKRVGLIVFTAFH